jgi:osmotically-inducible protein OsmY
MRTLAMLLVSGIVVLTGCSNANETNANAPTKMSNSDLEQVVKNKLATDAQTGTEKINVSADASQNEVTLSGTVSTERARIEAVEIAKSASPNLAVVDKIEVQPPEVARSQYTEDMARQAREKAKKMGDRLGNSLDDGWIHTKLVAKLIGDSETPARKINIDVVNQNVTLRGEVDSLAAKEEAGRVAMDTEGVKHVTNLLKVRAG